jgi:hypothetical protein
MKKEDKMKLCRENLISSIKTRINKKYIQRLVTSSMSVDWKQARGKGINTIIGLKKLNILKIAPQSTNSKKRLLNNRNKRPLRRSSTGVSTKCMIARINMKERSTMNLQESSSISIRSPSWKDLKTNF